MNNKYNWSTFTLQIDINASKSELFDLLSTQNGLEKWFLRSAKAFRSGQLLESKSKLSANDKYEWLWHGYSDEVMEKGSILRVVEGESISFTFSGGKNNNMQVEIKIHPSNNKQIVSLTQLNIPIDDEHKHLFHLGCSNGWTFYLTNLKSIAEHNIDLRNKDIELTKMVNS